jgi:hypothetical protein
MLVAGSPDEEIPGNQQKSEPVVPGTRMERIRKAKWLGRDDVGGNGF